jgi:hypothetical protein
MAKRQRFLSQHFLATTRNINICDLASGTYILDDLYSSSQIQSAQGIWKDHWYNQFDWLDFSFDLGRMFCKVCKERGGRSVYAKEGSKNLKISAFDDHGCFNEHKKLC